MGRRKGFEVAQGGSWNRVHYRKPLSLKDIILRERVN